ncbi:hypothetical protein [Luteibacter jiangsuensis]
MVREASEAQIARTGFERSHHMTAALYFGVAALEAFVNEHTRAYLRGQLSDEAILDILRYGKLRGGKKNDNLLTKLTEWPTILTGQSITVRSNSVGVIDRFIRIRGDLTHAKTNGMDLYRVVDAMASTDIVDVVAEYIAQFHQAAGSQFPYWLWGWNYLNPQSTQYEIMLMNEQQFVHSMAALGASVASFDPAASRRWQVEHMSDYAGYRRIGDALNTLDRCEPKHSAFIYQPKLCRRWWTTEHQATCGHVSEDALAQALAAERAAGQGVE